MATVLNVKTSDSAGHSVTYNIDNPKSIPDPLTRASIVAAFQYGIDNNILISSYGNAISSIDQIAYTTSEKIIVQGEPVYISPDSITLRMNQSTMTGSKVSTDVTVTNATVQAADVIFNDPTTFNQYFSAGTTTTNSVQSNQSTVTITIAKIATFNTLASYPGVLRIIIAGKNYDIPLTFNNSNE